MFGFVKKAYAALDDRVGISAVFVPIAKHPIPRGTGWWYVFGSATLVSFVVAVITGIPLAGMFTTATGTAYASLQWITHTAVLGFQIRSLHYWGGLAMLILIGVHALRVFLFGSYKYPREVNWMVGVLLLFITAGMLFTGQILRWDQNGVWTVVIVAAQADRFPFIGHQIANLLLGGDTFNASTLSHLFALHVFILPGIAAGMIGFHLYLVVHNGISERPKAGRPVDPKLYKAWYADLLKRDGEPFWPYAAWRDAVFATALVVVIVILALVVGPPDLVGPPNVANVISLPRPDWYFLWYFAALALLPPEAEDVLMIALPIVVITLMLLLPVYANKGERHIKRRPWAVGIAGVAVLLIVSLTFSGVEAPWSPRFDATPLTHTEVGTTTSTAVKHGAALWSQKGCEQCHMIDGHGGVRGPNLSDVASRLPKTIITIRILNGAYPNMPAFAGIISPSDLSDLVAFLSTRKHPTGPGAPNPVLSAPKSR